MSIAVEFSKQLGPALDSLADDEWAVASLRERIVDGVDAATAFANVTDVMNLARAQTDPYAFETCCWLAASLAEASNTTEMPPGLAEAVKQAVIASKTLGAHAAVQRVSDWYRIQTQPS